MTRIAIIPARGGSKRILKKNIKPFCGKPIIAYSIKAAIDSKLFSKVMVSTDDDEIKKVSLSFGASVPFLRSKENSNDFATLTEVILEVLDQYNKEGHIYDQFCCILPTAPLIKTQRIKESFQLLDESQFTSITPVVKFSYPIQRALKIENGNLTMMWPIYLKARSQDLPIAYHDSGQFYSVDVKTFLREQTLFTERSGAIELLETEVQDIDTLEDWQLAELKYKILMDKDG